MRQFFDLAQNSDPNLFYQSYKNFEIPEKSAFPSCLHHIKGENKIFCVYHSPSDVGNCYFHSYNINFFNLGVPSTFLEGLDIDYIVPLEVSKGNPHHRGKSLKRHSGKFPRT